jgi:hypothetical protein
VLPVLKCRRPVLGADNRHLGFSADGKLKTVDVTGGLPQAWPIPP